MKIHINRRTIKAKSILLTLLVVLLAVPSIGYAVTAKNKQDKPAEGVTEAPTSEPATTAPATTEPATTEPATESQPITLPAASSDGTPVIVSPSGDNWELTLVNLQYCLPEGYAPELAAAVEGSNVRLDARVAPAYQKMYEAAKADGCTLTPYSGYRTYDRQEDNYNRRVEYYVGQGFSEAEAKAKTQERILPAGCSEHNMGFAMDIGSASADFVSTKEFSWLCEHACEYGFILRYPENKTAVTGVMYEPWHWRYVGEKAAKDMRESGQCLEEYLAAKSAKNK